MDPSILFSVATMLMGSFGPLSAMRRLLCNPFKNMDCALISRKIFVWDQSNGWNVQKSEMRSVPALSRLWFILAVATLYLTAQGVEVVESGKRRWVDTHWFRGNSYFRIGWKWIKTALENGWKLIRQIRYREY